MTGRVQLALNVNDLAESVAFYTKLFGTEPAKVRPGYANFAIAEPPLKLVLLETPGQGGSLNHLGVEVADTGTVEAERLETALVTPIVIITSAQEAYFGALGAFAGQLPQRGLFADSGGASTQVASFGADGANWQRSLPIGASGISGAFLHGDPPSASERAAAIAASVAPRPQSTQPMRTPPSGRTYTNGPLVNLPLSCQVRFVCSEPSAASVRR